VSACAVCRADLLIVDGELPRPKRHLIPGHEIVGVVVKGGLGWLDSRWAIGWSFPGSGGPAASVRFADLIGSSWGGTDHSLGRQPDSKGRGGLSGPGISDARQDEGHPLPAGEGE
jgi:hypothetical protein